MCAVFVPRMSYYRSASARLKLSSAVTAPSRLRRCSAVLNSQGTAHGSDAPTDTRAFLRVSRCTHVDSASSSAYRTRVPLISHPLMKASYYDVSTATCRLCQEMLRSSYKAHSTDIMHMAQGVIAVLAAQIIEGHLRQVQRGSAALLSSSSSSLHDSHGRGRSCAESSKGVGCKSLLGARHEREHARHAATKSSPLFVPLPELPGVPSVETLARHPTLLARVDFTSAIIRGWWNVLCAPPSTSVAATATVSRPRPSRRSTSQPALPARTRSHSSYLDFLSSPYPQRRRRRLRFLLLYLKECGVIGTSLQSTTAASRIPSMNAPHESDHTAAVAASSSGMSGFSRSNRFDIYEVYGDFLMKAFTHDYLGRVIASTTPENAYCTNLIQRLIDSNAGLRAIYDYLGLSDIVQASLADNKSKADVVESLLGELQMLHVSCQTYHGTESFPSSFCRGERYLGAIVEHVLHELVRCVLMWRFQRTVKATRSFIEQELNVEEVSKALQKSQRHLEDEHDRYDVLPKLRCGGAQKHPCTMGKRAPHEHHHHHHVANVVLTRVPIYLHLQDRPTPAPTRRGTQSTPERRGDEETSLVASSVSSKDVQQNSKMAHTVQDSEETRLWWTYSPLTVVHDRDAYQRALMQCAAETTERNPGDTASGSEDDISSDDDDDGTDGDPDAPARQRVRGVDRAVRGSRPRGPVATASLSAAWKESARLNASRGALYKRVRHMHLSQSAVSTLLGQRMDALVRQAGADSANYRGSHMSSYNVLVLASQPSPAPASEQGGDLSITGPVSMHD